MDWTAVPLSAVVGALSGLGTSALLLRRRRSDPLRRRDTGPPVPPDERPVSQGCTLPPPGWYCTREVGHSGPCAALPNWDDPRR